MKSLESQHLSQETMNAYDTSRTLSDAELIKAGAAYESGRLVVALAQIEQLRDNLQDDTRASLRLHNKIDNLEAQLLVPQSNMERVIENEAQLRVAIDMITEPYAGLFLDMVPSPELNPRGWRGKKIKTDWRGRLWRYETLSKRSGHLDIAYAVGVEYAPSDENNVLESSVVAIHNPSRQDYYEQQRFTYPTNIYSLYGNVARVSMGYSNDRLTAVSLEDKSSDNDVIKVGKALFDLGITKTIKCYPRLQLTSGDIKLVLGEKIEYRFDPNENDFKIVFKSKNVYGGSELPETISVSDYLSILRDILSLIPTKPKES